MGKGHGVVLDEQGCDVHAEEAGLLFVISGDPRDAVAKAWKKVGALAIGAKGLVVLDAAEVGAEKGVNRARVPLAAGTYDVLAHRPGRRGCRLQRGQVGPTLAGAFAVATGELVSDPPLLRYLWSM